MISAWIHLGKISWPGQKGIGDQVTGWVTGWLKDNKWVESIVNDAFHDNSAMTVASWWFLLEYIWEKISWPGELGTRWPGISRYFQVPPGIDRYQQVSPGISRYNQVFPFITRYYQVTRQVRNLLIQRAMMVFMTRPWQLHPDDCCLPPFCHDTSQNGAQYFLDFLNCIVQRPKSFSIYILVLSG